MAEAIARYFFPSRGAGARINLTMTQFAALIPFGILFCSFAFLRMNLLHASFIAMLVCTLLSQQLFHATQQIWTESLQNTGIFIFEIGLILIGAFFFIEIAKRTRILDSLADLVREISPDRIVQGVLVTFPLEFMIEGSSGFGTPILMIAPILRALGFPLLLCATLPFVNMVAAIPFGALGTPIRLGFLQSDAAIRSLSHETAYVVLPFVLIAPFVTAGLIHRLDPEARAQKRNPARIALWLLFLSAVYAAVNLGVSRLGPEFPALASALFTFIAVIVTRRWFFPSEHTPLRSLQGIKIYGLLLLVFWIGKQIWLDEKIPGTPLRWFNPGWVFFIFGTVLMFLHRLDWAEVGLNTLYRARRTLGVFFCMTWIVQQLKSTGALNALASGIPPALLTEGTGLLGWTGSILVGTSTMANLFLSPLFAAPFHAWLAVGSAIGVQLAFQSVSAARSILHDEVEERAIYRILAPISLGFVLILTLALYLYGKVQN
jgi:lactate permease